MSPRKLPRTLTRDQVDALLAMPNVDCPSGLRDRALMTLMWRAGLRVTETCGLHLRDVHWKERELHIRPEIAKGGVEAMLPLDDLALDWLERWKPVRRRHAAGAPFLFVTLDGGQLSRRAVYKMVVRRADKAGIGHVHPHVLRHTFATDLLRDSFDVREVQHLMRHADLRTTATYLHVHNRELSERVRQRN